MPEYDYLFLADTKNKPYGEKSFVDIKEFTFSALNHLFDQGVSLVILACNTAATASIRDWQSQFSEKKVLSVTIPGIEGLMSKDYKDIAVLATELTVKSGIYDELYTKIINGPADLRTIAAGDLVAAIEQGGIAKNERLSLIQKYLDKFSKNTDCLMLGCTHYSVWKEGFAELFDGDIVDPSYLSALALKKYLQRHADIRKNIGKNGKTKFYVTGNLKSFEDIGSVILGEKIKASLLVI